jgi:hypothetical protein
MFVDGIQKKENIHSFLMIGQSNMAGRGNFGEVPPIQNDRCFMLRMGRWQAMSEPINPDRAIFRENCTCGVSLAASFADEYAKTTGFEVGLIPCADGGTIIEQWQPGQLLYDHAVMMAKLAMRTSHLTGILWHQGESDCRNLKEEEYRHLFFNLMDSLRRDLGMPELPLIIGEVSEHINPKHGMHDTPALNRLLHQLQAEYPNCAIVEAKELPLKDDGVHFTAASCRELGKRYFEAYQSLIQK